MPFIKPKGNLWRCMNPATLRCTQSMFLFMGEWIQSRQAIVEAIVWKEGISAGPDSEQILNLTRTQHPATA